MKIFILSLFLTIISSSLAYAACTNPAGVESQIRYDFSANKMYYCNNTDWILMDKVGSNLFGSNFVFAENTLNALNIERTQVFQDIGTGTTIR